MSQACVVDRRLTSFDITALTWMLGHPESIFCRYDPAISLFAHGCASAGSRVYRELQSALRWRIEQSHVGCLQRAAGPDEWDGDGIFPYAASIRCAQRIPSAPNCYTTGGHPHRTKR
jgi:hypothetical protein